MSGNPLPWIVLASVVLASLHFKGYLKLPAAKPAAPHQSSSIVSQVAGPGPANIDSLVGLGSHALRPGLRQGETDRGGRGPRPPDRP